MNTPRLASAGKTRACPHCKATILDSSTVCPGCRHHLRFDAASVERPRVPTSVPLHIEGTIRRPPGGESLEYSVVLAVKNEKGVEINRQVVGVGALHPSDQRTFTLSVELFGGGNGSK